LSTARSVCYKETAKGKYIFLLQPLPEGGVLCETELDRVIAWRSR
jgi:hypothetical protein